MVTLADRGLVLPHLGRDQESQQVVERFFDRLGSLASLSAAALRILEATSDPHAGAGDVLKAVEGDPAIASRMLRLVNSAFYGLRRAVKDLKTAITLLGFREIRNLALTACLADTFRGIGKYGTFSREGLWRHSTAVAAVARTIAKTSGRANPGEAYLAGLLHDLGLIVIDQYLHRPFCKVIDQLGPEAPTCSVERAVLGFDHAELGAFLGARWRFPEDVTAAIRLHHAPQGCPGPQQPMVAAVAMGNFLCALNGLSSVGVRNVAEPPAEVLEWLAFEHDDLALLREHLDDTLSTARDVAAV